MEYGMFRHFLLCAIIQAHCFATQIGDFFPVNRSSVWVYAGEIDYGNSRVVTDVWEKAVFDRTVRVLDISNAVKDTVYITLSVTDSGLIESRKDLNSPVDTVRMVKHTVKLKKTPDEVFIWQPDSMEYIPQYDLFFRFSNSNYPPESLIVVNVKGKRCYMLGSIDTTIRWTQMAVVQDIGLYFSYRHIMGNGWHDFRRLVLKTFNGLSYSLSDVPVIHQSWQMNKRSKDNTDGYWVTMHPDLFDGFGANLKGRELF
jgi:hypothetical protein